jgi:two-component system, chemotaxis family, sensor kinase Cph1
MKAPHILSRIIYPDDMPRLMAHFTRLAAAAEGEILDFEYRVYAKAGDVRWVHSRDTIFSRLPNGRVSQILGIAQDISARKAAEDERERLIQELENRNAELERFTYTVSHDLKSPLITIRGFVGFLEEDIRESMTEQVATDLAHIREAADKMSRLLDELLALSRVGRLMNPPQEAPLAELAEEALRLVAGRIYERGVAVTIQPDLPIVYGDRARLVEVLQNLIDNAVKYAGQQPSPHVWIGARQQHGEWVYFVQDNGPGIAPQYHETVFGLFEKLESDSEGTGIGLALAKRIIEVHQGRLWVESEPGHGATFCFTLGARPLVE